MINIKKNDLLRLTIEDMTNLGCGVAHPDAFTVFVNGGVTGDVLTGKIIKVTKSYAVARIEVLHTPSPHRTDARACPVAARCGGCSYRHIDRGYELKIKQDNVRSALRRAGLCGIEVGETQSDGHADRYRNKAQYPVARGTGGELLIGFYSPGTHRVVDTPDCLQLPEDFSRVTSVFREFIEQTGLPVYDEATGEGILRHIYLRRAGNGRLLICAVIRGERLPGADRLVAALRRAVPSVSGVLLNRNDRDTNVVLGREYRTLWGAPFLEDTLCGLTFRLSPASFYQVNRGGAELLYSLARQAAALTGDETLLDLYCGAGTIGLSMARDARRVFGVDIVAEAIENARHNARANGIENAGFAAADAGDAEALFAAARRALGEDFHADVVILDPPRRGCAPALLDAVAQHAPARVVYVSCNPDTLARDLVLLGGHGYFTRRITPVDLFPGTGHVECVCCLAREQ